MACLDKCGLISRVVTCGIYVVALAVVGVPRAAAESSLTVAAVSCEIKVGQIDHNLQQIEHWARKASEAGADLVLFPECSLHGWWLSRENRRHAETLNGKSVQRVCQIAEKHNIHLAVGMTESDQGQYYLTHVVASPDGVIAFHRKSALAGGNQGEGAVWDQGNDANVFRLRDFTLGIAICFESVHPETCRALKKHGAEVILAPYANGTSPAEIQDPERKQRSWLWDRIRENRVWYVACDATPHDADGGLRPGAAFIIDPNQRLVACTKLDAPLQDMVIHTIRKAAQAEADE